MPPNLSGGDSRPYAVLQSTLDEDCWQAEEPKQFVDEASRFHLRRQRQHSAVICSGALLFSSRVLRPSLVTLCSHMSVRCAVELYHASHQGRLQGKQKCGLRYVKTAIFGTCGSNNWETVAMLENAAAFCSLSFLSYKPGRDRLTYGVQCLM